MPQSLNQKTVNNFVKGLITEAAELTFPEGASVNELNCDLRRDGSRRRRESLTLESNSILSSFTISDTELFNTGNWVNVNGNASLEFLAVQKGNTLYFYNKAELPYSGQIVSGSVALSDHEFAGSVGSNNSKCQFASINGTLIVSSEAINTIVVSWDGTSLSVATISFKTRDFEWQGNTDSYSEPRLSNANRDYDTANSGWVGSKGAAALATYKAANSNQLPPLTHPWYAGKDADNAFDAAEWALVYAGSSLTGNGHFVLDFFSKVRSGLPTEVEASRFKSVASFSGRVFYGGLTSAKHAGTIVFSRLVEDNADLGKCYQQNDPTSEYFSDLLATDGGFINIPDAVNIQLLYPFRSSLFVFAENGVWQITGVDGIFSATAYGVNRVSSIGLANPQSFIQAEGLPFWWSRFGIHTLSMDSVSGQGSEQNLTITSIQTFWDAIDTDAKSKVTAVYDSINKKIYWAYPNNGETVSSKLNNILVLDLTLQAFYPWKVSDEASSSSCIVGVAFYSGFGAAELDLDVVASQQVATTTTYAITVASVGGSNYFHVDGTSHPVLNLVRGSTYIFDVSNASNDGHPLRFKNSDDSSYTTGVVVSGTQGQSNAKVTLTVATDAPSSLKYYCTAHGNSMGNTINVTTSTDLNDVVQGDDDIISTQVSDFTTGDPALVLLVRNGSDNKLTMATFSGDSFLDWGTQNYSSFAESGYDFSGDLILKKNAPYLAVYSRLTETGFTVKADGGYTSNRSSSLLVSSAWDFNETFGAAQQAYRFKFPIIVDPENLSTFTYPEDVITTRLKVRGHGRSVRLRYESEQGKDFILLGWGLVIGRNTRY